MDRLLVSEQMLRLLGSLSNLYRIPLDAALLGQQFPLPLTYFEHRPTGTLVARLHGVETVSEIGERGVGLPGGPRQSMAIARALLKKPRTISSTRPYQISTSRRRNTSPGSSTLTRARQP